MSETVDGYLKRQPPEVRASLETVRAILRDRAPRAVERISYGIPTYTLDGAPLLYFAGWKKHYALYPVSPELLASVKGEGAGVFDVEKGTLRLSYDEPVPVALIARLAEHRAHAIEAKPPAKKTSKKAPVKKPAKKPVKKPVKKPAKKAPAKNTSKKAPAKKPAKKAPAKKRR